MEYDYGMNNFVSWYNDLFIGYCAAVFFMVAFAEQKENFVSSWIKILASFTHFHIVVGNFVLGYIFILWQEALKPENKKGAIVHPYYVLDTVGIPLIIIVALSFAWVLKRRIRMADSLDELHELDLKIFKKTLYPKQNILNKIKTSVAEFKLGEKKYFHAFNRIKRKEWLRKVQLIDQSFSKNSLLKDHGSESSLHKINLIIKDMIKTDPDLAIYLGDKIASHFREILGIKKSESKELVRAVQIHFIRKLLFEGKPHYLNFKIALKLLQVSIEENNQDSRDKIFFELANYMADQVTKFSMDSDEFMLHLQTFSEFILQLDEEFQAEFRGKITQNLYYKLELNPLVLIIWHAIYYDTKERMNKGTEISVQFEREYEHMLSGSRFDPNQAQADINFLIELINSDLEARIEKYPQIPRESFSNFTNNLESEASSKEMKFYLNKFLILGMFFIKRKTNPDYTIESFVAEYSVRVPAIISYNSIEFIRRFYE